MHYFFFSHYSPGCSPLYVDKDLTLLEGVIPAWFLCQVPWLISEAYALPDQCPSVGSVAGACIPLQSHSRKLTFEALPFFTSRHPCLEPQHQAATAQVLLSCPGI